MGMTLPRRAGRSNPNLVALRFGGSLPFVPQQRKKPAAKKKAPARKKPKKTGQDAQKDPAVHRPLVLATPAPRGQDVEELQKAINAYFRESLDVDFKLKLDGKLGKKTLWGARAVAYSMGAGAPQLKKLKGGRIGPSVQRLIRRKRKRTELEITRSQRRAKYREKLRARFNDSAKKTVEAALQQRGIVEKPAGSNRGRPKPELWQTYWASWMVGQPYCGAFAGYYSKVFGGAPITERVVYTPNTVLDGRARANGYRKWVSPAAAKPGDHVMFDFDGGGADHTGIVVAVRSGSLLVIEANTSSDDGGSQDNGGGVFLRERPFSLMLGCARPAYT